MCEARAILSNPDGPGNETPQEAECRQNGGDKAEEAALVAEQAKSDREGGEEHDQREDEAQNGESKGSLTRAAWLVKQIGGGYMKESRKIRIFLGPTSPPFSVYSWQTSSPFLERVDLQKPRVP